MQHLLKIREDKQRKTNIVAVRSGDMVRVHQRIKEGSKTRTQIFEGLVIRVDREKSLSARITVRRIASGVGVEKSFLLHSPLVERVDVVKRSNVRRNYLTYMRTRSGKSAKLAGVAFDFDKVNAASIEQQRAEAEALTPQTDKTEAVKETKANEMIQSDSPASSQLPEIPQLEAKASNQPESTPTEAAEKIAE